MRAHAALWVGTASVWTAMLVTGSSATMVRTLALHGGVAVPPAKSLFTRDWFGWSEAYASCVADKNTSAPICACNKATYMAAQDAGQQVPLSEANAAAYGKYRGTTVPVVAGASVTFNHSEAQQDAVATFAANAAKYGCGFVLARSDCMASGEFSSSAVDPDMGSCKCIPSSFVNGIGSPAGALCSLVGATDSDAIALLEGMGYLQMGPNGADVDSVGDFGMPKLADGKSLPGSQVACQNADDIVAGACPYSPGRPQCAPDITGQACDAVMAAVAPPGKNAIWNVTDTGLVPACPKDSHSSIWIPAVKACVRSGTMSLWCNSRGYIRGQTRTGTPICACKPGYSGNSCQFVLGCPTACDAVNQFCDVLAKPDPQCTCLPGYSSAGPGKPCSKFDPSTNATCAVTCLNGFCATPSNCSCREGWSGADCSTPRCPDNCNGVGECQIGPGGTPQCVCPFRFKLPTTCSNAESALAGPCKNNGAIDKLGLRCNCVGGYVGQQCDKYPSCSVCCAIDRCTCLGGPSLPVCRAPWHPSGQQYCCNYYHCLDGEGRVVDGLGRLVRIADMGKGSTALSLLESSGSVVVESVSEVSETVHDVSRVAALCLGTSAAAVMRALSGDGDIPLCTVVSFGHGMAVAADADGLARSRLPTAVRDAVLKAVPLVGTGSTFVPVGDIVALHGQAAAGAFRADSTGTRVVELEAVGLRGLDAVGVTDAAGSATVLAYGFESVADLPRHARKWQAGASRRAVKLFSYVVPSGRQTVAMPAAATEPSAADVTEALAALGLPANTTLCMPHGEDGPAPRLSPAALVALARGLTAATTNCSSTNGTVIGLSRLVGGVTAEEDTARRFAPEGFTVPPPIREGSPSVNDGAAMQAALASSSLADFLRPCPVVEGAQAASAAVRGTP